MSGYQLLIYFSVWVIIFILVLEVFSWLLRRIVALGGIAKVFFVVFFYLLVAFIFSLPLFGLNFLEHKHGMSFAVERILIMVGYLVCLWIPVMFFKNSHVDRLKGLGYFKSKF